TLPRATHLIARSRRCTSRACGTCEGRLEARDGARQDRTWSESNLCHCAVAHKYRAVAWCAQRRERGCLRARWLQGLSRIGFKDRVVVR
ncbi:hypothetical protein PIB30_078547, partial [Stylosanthes scabra]|nr:hypothetical protein [Stylosanthes scabra]